MWPDTYSLSAPKTQPEARWPVKGSYVLLIRLTQGQTIRVGLRSVHFPGGYYAYVGSALGGLKARLRRHLKADKKRYWHIDYLLEKAAINGIFIAETQDRIECRIAQELGLKFDPVPGFGSSDCNCPSHLFFSLDEEKIESAARSAFSSLAIKPSLVRILPRAIPQ